MYIVYQSGQKIGNYIYLKELIFDRKPKEPRKGVFECLCGTVFSANIAQLKCSGATMCPKCKTEKKSKSHIKHGYGGTNKGGGASKEYKSWTAMKTRCNSMKGIDYENYFLRGIFVCVRWSSFSYFLEDMGFCPKDKVSIDRIDNSKGYFKENCRWATSSEQNKNKRNNVVLEYRGEKMILSDWATRIKIPPRQLHQRIFKLGWSIKESIETPIMKRGQHFNRIFPKIKHTFGFINA